MKGYPRVFRRIEEFTVERGQENSRVAKKLAETAGNLRIVDKARRTSDYREGKSLLHVASKKGNAFGVCASLSEEYMCCNVHVLRSVSNCPYDCSYCFLQNYLTNSSTSVTADTEAMIREIKEITARQPWRFFRIGTWELGDSLALERYTGSAAELVEAFSRSRITNCALELKTKSGEVDGLLGLDHGGRVVVAWSVNPPAVIKSEELKAASLDERLEAMVKVSEAGYLVALHFDPLIHYAGWEDDYEELVERVFGAVAPERVAWISMGCLRFNPEMKKKIENNFPKSRITSAEMVLGGDGKMRYVKPLRVDMLSRVYEAIRKHAGDEPFVYLCMERWDVWDKTLGYHPSSIGRLDYLMTDSLYRRYPGLVHQKPDAELYERDS